MSDEMTVGQFVDRVEKHVVYHHEGMTFRYEGEVKLEDWKTSE